MVLHTHTSHHDTESVTGETQPVRNVFCLLHFRCRGVMVWCVCATPLDATMTASSALLQLATIHVMSYSNRFENLVTPCLRTQNQCYRTRSSFDDLKVPISTSVKVFEYQCIICSFRYSVFEYQYCNVLVFTIVWHSVKNLLVTGSTRLSNLGHESWVMNSTIDSR